jgi:hypothetical protein
MLVQRLGASRAHADVVCLCPLWRSQCTHCIGEPGRRRNRTSRGHGLDGLGYDTDTLVDVWGPPRESMGCPGSTSFVKLPRQRRFVARNAQHNVPSHSGHEGTGLFCHLTLRMFEKASPSRTLYIAPSRTLRLMALRWTTGGMALNGAGSERSASLALSYANQRAAWGTSRHILGVKDGVSLVACRA